MKEKKKLSELERIIVSKQRAIDRAEEKKNVIMKSAQEKCDEIDRGIATKKILLDAIRRGVLPA